MSDEALAWVLKELDTIGSEMGYRHGWKKAAARRLGIAPAMASRYMNGVAKPGPGVVLRAAVRLGVTPPDWAANGKLGRADQSVAPATDSPSELDVLGVVSGLTADEWRRVRAWADDYFGEAAK